jgi:hypothetical protein
MAAGATQRMKQLPTAFFSFSPFILYSFETIHLTSAKILHRLGYPLIVVEFAFWVVRISIQEASLDERSCRLKPLQGSMSRKPGYFPD